MPDEVEYKLTDLAKIALGSPNLTNVHVAILHSLLGILLKKMNCQNDIVSLGAVESKHLDKILETSKISPLAFNDEKFEVIAIKLERLQKIEDRINVLESKLEKHLAQTEKLATARKTMFNWESWEAHGCEDFCTICDGDNDVTCKLVKSTDFLAKLLRRISAPMVNRIMFFDIKVEKLHKEFTEFIKRTEEEFLKIQLLDKCIQEIGTLRLKVDENHRLFLVTMEEIQDMLDAKLDKFHMPALKKYIRDHFQDVDKNISTLKAKKDCPKAAGIIMDGVRSLSCGDREDCTDVGAQPAAMLPDMKKAKNHNKILKNCGCPYDTSNNAQTTANALKLNDVTFVPKPKPKFQRESEDDQPKCRKAGDDFDLMEGFDGNLYRKG